VSRRDVTPGLFGELDPDPVPASGPFAAVALNRPVRQVFTYTIPSELEARTVPGVRVAVPFGARREIGVVVGVLAESDVAPRRLRSVLRVLDDEPLLDPPSIELTRWIADEYACAWGEALHALLPAALKRERGESKVWMVGPVPGIGAAELAQLEARWPAQHRLLRTVLELGVPGELRDVLRSLNLSDSPARTLARKGWVRMWQQRARTDPLLVSQSDRRRPERLSAPQAAAVAAITSAIDDGRGEAFLLEGVTGSGKTEVYLRAIEHARELGRSAIVLVPEIALTPQTVGWFRSRFEGVAVLHSRMTDAQRLDMWMRARRGEAPVVVGARSAIFAPVRDLGVVVVDEEHEPSFKQGTAPRYHARAVALRRAAQAGAVCVLGSATPALESRAAAERGELTRLQLRKRIGDKPLPPVEIVDMRQAPRVAGGLFSERLQWLVGEALRRGEQAILFQNRRGFAPVLWCPGCRETVRCRTCAVSLTFHRRIRRAVCHACCSEIAPPTACPTCTMPGLRYLGAGSERIDSELRAAFPDARVRRMDSDTMRRREDYEEVLAAFGRGEVDLLVGTQMIAKGLDFPRVTVVGIVDADGALHLPDFRAAERTFQLIAQVAGRAGRGDLPGRIVVQTSSPEHPAIRCAAEHDYAGFAAGEIANREEIGYPPAGRLVRLLFEDDSEVRVVDAVESAGRHLRDALEPAGVDVLGPAPAPFALLRGRHRHHLLLKAATAPALERARAAAIEIAESSTRPRAVLDVDPIDLL